MNKKNKYQELCKKIAEHYSENKNGLGWYKPCNEINLWTYWQGIGNYDTTKILLVGQDWGDPEIDKYSSFKNKVIDINQNVFSNLKGTIMCEEYRMPTDNNMVELFSSIGYDILKNSLEEPKNKELFFTNLILGYRTDKKFSGNFKNSWLDNTAKEFFSESVKLLNPKTIVCLGRRTYEGVLSALGVTTKWGITNFNNILDSGINFEDVVIEGNMIRVFAVAHCGGMGTANRNRSKLYDEKTMNSLDLQKRDWKEIGNYLK